MENKSSVPEACLESAEDVRRLVGDVLLGLEMLDSVIGAYEAAAEHAEEPGGTSLYWPHLMSNLRSMVPAHAKLDQALFKHMKLLDQSMEQTRASTKTVAQPRQREKLAALDIATNQS